MSRTASTNDRSTRSSRARHGHGRGGSSQRRRPAPPTGPLAQSPALRELAEALERTTEERTRQRDRDAAIARQRADQRAREESDRRDRRHRFQLRNRPRAVEERRILNLLRRGAGITQIMREIVERSDGMSDVRRRAEHIDEMLRAVAAGAPETSRIRMPARDVQRYRGFLRKLITGMNEGRAPDLNGHPAWVPAPKEIAAR
jgi:hypothetical protein